jgi:integrase
VRVIIEETGENGPIDGAPSGHGDQALAAIDQPDLTREAALAAQYAQKSKAANTRRAYNLDWRTFVNWCELRNLDARKAKPPAVAAFLADMAARGHAAVSVSRMATGIKHYMRRIDPGAWPHERELPLPVKLTLAGIRRTHGIAPKNARTALTLSMLRRMLPHMGSGLEGRRNRAILLTGFWCAMRRSEIAAIDVEDVTINGQGMTVVSRRSKTDQEGEGFERGVEHTRDASICAPCEVTRWLQDSEIHSGPLFRSLIVTDDKGNGAPTDLRIDPGLVTSLVQHGVKSIGMRPHEFGAHSLRVGLITLASEKGKSLQSIMRQTGHRSVKSVMRYIRHATVFVDNVTRGLEDDE